MSLPQIKELRSWRRSRICVRMKTTILNLKKCSTIILGPALSRWKIVTSKYILLRNLKNLLNFLRTILGRIWKMSSLGLINTLRQSKRLRAKLKAQKPLGSPIKLIQRATSDQKLYMVIFLIDNSARRSNQNKSKQTSAQAMSLTA